jgi:hypothetical protein
MRSPLQKVSALSDEKNNYLVDQGTELAVFLTAGGCTVYRQFHIYFCLGGSSLSVYGTLRVLHTEMDHSWRLWDCPFDTCRP